MSLRVLAVDDSRTMRNLLDAALKRAGFQVDLAEDGDFGTQSTERVKPAL